LLFGLVFWTFFPSLECGFITIDDAQFVRRNPHITLTWANLVWAACNPVAANWHPLTLWSFVLDHQLYGLKPWGYHLTNVWLHAVSSVLVFLVLRRMTGATWRSLMVAMLFGLHPQRVQSVTWISERKDVLSVLFWMLTLWAYTRYAQVRTRFEPALPGSNTPRSRKLKTGNGRLASGLPARRSAAQTTRSSVFNYSLALVFFALSLMCKPMVVTLPCVLLVLDYWPLARWSRKNLRGLLVEKAPFFLLAAIMSAVTYFIQKDAGAMSTVYTGLSLSLGARLENALVSYARYLGKLVWPADLCALYPHPGCWPTPKILFAGALVLGLSVLVFARRRQQPYLLTGWLWYLGTLVPVIGLVQAGSQSMADRYSYIPSIGILMVLVWGAHQLTKRWPSQGVIGGAIGGALVLACIGLTRYQIGFWTDDVRLWQRAVAVTENNYDAHNCLGRAWFSLGRMDEAIHEFQEVIRLNPGYAEAYYSLGHSLATKGRLAEAESCYQKALELRPDYVVAQDSLDSLLLQMGQADQVIIRCQKALEVDPADAIARLNLGSALFQKGRLDEAIVQYQKALQIKPDSAETRINLGTALFQKGRLDEAIAQYQKALESTPNSAEACFNLGNALAAQGHLDEALACYRKVLEIRPDHVEARNSLGRLLFQKGNVEEAIVHFKKVLQINPEQVEARVNLGTALFQKGQVDEAIVQYQKALQIKPNVAEACFALGYALNSQGRFDEAAVHFQKALALDPNLAEAHYNLGFAWYSQGRLEDAIRELQAALRLKPDYVEASNNLAAILSQKEKPARQSPLSAKPEGTPRPAGN
jgi:tetratricopeptide (TPR) repeat protein